MDWALIASSIGLVIVTAGLVYFTKGLVDEARMTRTEIESARAEMVAAREEAVRTREEMEETRRLSVRPHLALGVRMIAPNYGVATIENLGPGAAIDIRLHLSYEPGGFQRPWAWPTMAAGDVQEFLVPVQADDLNSLAAKSAIARATGTYEDIYAQSYTLEAEHDFKAWWDVASRANRRFQEPPAERVVRWLEKIAKAIEALAERP
jgi:hypothetical protein